MARLTSAAVSSVEKKWRKCTAKLAVIRVLPCLAPSARICFAMGFGHSTTSLWFVRFDSLCSFFVDFFYAALKEVC